MPERTRKLQMRWVVCALLFLVTTVNYMDRSALGLVEPILRHFLGSDQNLALYNNRYSAIVTCFIVALPPRPSRSVCRAVAAILGAAGIWPYI